MNEMDEKVYRFLMLLLHPCVQEFLEVLGDLDRLAVKDPNVALALRGDLGSEIIIR